MSIPKRLISIWLNPNPVLPGLIEKCLPTHLINGWEHLFITLDNYREYLTTSLKYVEESIDNKNYVKAVDYLRIWLLWKYGGVYCDMDVQVLKPFTDEMFSHRLFLGVEKGRMLSNAVIGAEAGHPLLKEYLDRVDSNFKGSGDLIYEAGNGIWHNLLLKANQDELGIRIYEPDYFFPYWHEDGTTNITENTICNHLFFKSWV
jgi:mannosyltransferase OCH1-like enzyme